MRKVKKGRGKPKPIKLPEPTEKPPRKSRISTWEYLTWVLDRPDVIRKTQSYPRSVGDDPV